MQGVPDETKVKGEEERAVLEDGKGKWEYFGSLVVFE
jgi:hypothetical protein